MSEENNNTPTPENTGGVLNGAKETAKGIGEVFTKAKGAGIGSHLGNTNEGLNRAKEALSKATEAKNEGAIENSKHILKGFVEGRSEVFSKMNFAEKTVAKVGGNWGKAGNIEKIGRLGGSAIGLGAVISGGKDIFAPARDENGERKNGFAKTALKLAGGAALIYASLIHGGKGKAMGIS